MSLLDEWITDAERAAGLPPGQIPPDLRDALLALTRDVAHDVTRIAGPLTCYLAGIAVGRGAASGPIVSALQELAVARAEPGPGEPDAAAAGPTAEPADPATITATRDLSPGAAS